MMETMLTRDIKRARLFLAGLALLVVLPLFLFSCTRPSPRLSDRLPEQRSRPHIVIADLERQIHHFVNNERKRYGLHVIAWDEALARIARQHSRDMATRNFFAHESPEGHDFSYRYHQEGYRCGISTGTTIHLGAENILQNNLYDSVITVNGEAFYDWNSQVKIAETTVQGWMKSPGHRHNILTPYWNNEGIGVFITPDGKVYITQNFC
jgi:uncharacterized protein YkwD